MNVFCLGPEQIDELWNEYSCHLERYESETGIESVEYIRSELRAGMLQLWGLQSEGRVLGVVLTKIQRPPRGACCEIHAACGTSTDLYQAVSLMLPEIENWARSLGCVRMRLQGRRGWLRVLSDYEQTAVVMEKEF